MTWKLKACDKGLAVGTRKKAFLTAETRQRKEGVLTKVVLQQTFGQVVWSSSIALVKENQPHVIITNVF